MLADAEGVDPQTVGKNGFLDDVAEHMGLRQKTAIGIASHVAECVKTELEGVCHTIDSTSPPAG